MKKNDHDVEFSKTSDKIANATILFAFWTMIVTIFFALFDNLFLIAFSGFLMIIEFSVGYFLSQRMLSKELRLFQDRFTTVT